MVHGATPDDVRKDEEGMQIMRILGRNMAYYLKCIEAGKEKGIKQPEQEKTNLIYHWDGDNGKKEKKICNI